MQLASFERHKSYKFNNESFQILYIYITKAINKNNFYQYILYKIYLFFFTIRRIIIYYNNLITSIFYYSIISMSHKLLMFYKL